MNCFILCKSHSFDIFYIFDIKVEKLSLWGKNHNFAQNVNI